MQELENWEGMDSNSLGVICLVFGLRNCRSSERVGECVVRLPCLW